MINIEKTVHTQNEINNENEVNARPGTPRALLIEEYFKDGLPILSQNVRSTPELDYYVVRLENGK